MGLISFLQRHETNRILRKNRSVIQNELDKVLSREKPAQRPVTLSVKTPNGNHVIDDAIGRNIIVGIPHRYEKVTQHGEIVTVTDKITIELEINYG